LISHHALSVVQRNTVPAGSFRRACVKFSDPFVGTTLRTSRTRMDSTEPPFDGNHKHVWAVWVCTILPTLRNLDFWYPVLLAVTAHST
jgi:hypothetical protein